MRLTDQETEFIKKYRRLADYDRETVDGLLDYLATEKRKRGWKMVKEDGDVR